MLASVTLFPRYDTVLLRVGLTTAWWRHRFLRLTDVCRKLNLLSCYLYYTVEEAVGGKSAAGIF
jgi:hypothetical protein